MQPHCGDLHFTSWISASSSVLFSSKKLEAFSYLGVLMSQYSLFEEKPNKLLNLEYADGFEESSPLVPSSSSFLGEVEQLGSSLDGLMILK